MKKRNIIVVSAAFSAACLAAGWFALNGQAVSESAGHKTVYSTAEESVSISESVLREVSVIRAYEEPWPILQADDVSITLSPIFTCISANLNRV